MYVCILVQYFFLELESQQYTIMLNKMDKKYVRILLI